MTVMYLLDTIFSNLDDGNIQKLLKNYTIYAVPRLSPDGSEYYLTTPGTLRSAPRLYHFEAPMPGLQRQDMDGDGVIPVSYTHLDVYKIQRQDRRALCQRDLHHARFPLLLSLGGRGRQLYTACG